MYLVLVISSYAIALIGFGFLMYLKKRPYAPRMLYTTAKGFLVLALCVGAAAFLTL